MFKVSLIIAPLEFPKAMDALIATGFNGFIIEKIDKPKPGAKPKAVGARKANGSTKPNPRSNAQRESTPYIPFVDRVKSLLAAQNLAPGAPIRLDPLKALAKRVNMSQTLVYSSLKELVGEGLVVRTGLGKYQMSDDRVTHG